MTRFWWVRHGPTHAKSMVGWTDLAADLSDQPRITRLQAHLPNDAIVVSSDLKRAIDTATAIEGASQRLAHLPALREMHFGAWERRTAAEIHAENPNLIRDFWDKPGDVAPPGGESWNTLCARVDRAVDGLLQRYDGRDIIAVAHFGPILTQVQRALGVSAYKALGQKIDNLSVTCLEHRASGWTVREINHCP